MIYSRDVHFNEKSTNSEIGETLCTEEDKHFVELELNTEESSDHLENEVATSEATVQPVLRRSERAKQTPEFYGERASISDSQAREPTTPTTLDEALESSDKEKWVEAMAKEIKSLDDNKVWTLTELPKDRTPVGSKWVFKVKILADGSVERYKARLVAQGFSQKFGTDYDETFCPVIRLESLRALIALAVQNDLQIHQIDVTTAFLNGELEEEVYMKQPDGFISQMVSSRGEKNILCVNWRKAFMV